MKILIGSKNPGKIEGATKAFNRYFKGVEVVGVSVPSNVPNQPQNEEIYEGAKNRVLALADYAKQNNIDAKYFVAVESGISNLLGKWVIISMSCIMDSDGNISWGSSSAFPVPDKYVNTILEKDLGTVMDELFKTNDIHSTVGGISMLTHEQISRIDLNDQAFTMALTQFINGDLWCDFK